MLSRRYPMYVIPLSTLLEMNEFRPHQELLADGTLVEANVSMAPKTIFISHQWLGFDHPDPKSEQLRALQQVLRRLLEGRTSVTSGKYYGAASLGIHKVCAAEWKDRLRGAYVWFDFMCACPRAADCDHAARLALCPQH